MLGVNDQEQPSRQPARDPDQDPLDSLVDTLLESEGASRSEVAHQLRTLLPSALAELSESNRRLRESAQQKDAMVNAGVLALRAASELLRHREAGVDRAEMARRLDQLAQDLDRSIPAPAPEPRPRPPRPEEAPARLLIADDEADAREALSLVLEPDYEVLAAADGQQAVDLARAERPDIVLLDLNMPRLDGFQAIERLRADPVTADIPVIFVSGHGDDAVKERGLGLGAVDYLQKPFSERELRARVERTLRLVRSQSKLRELAQTDALTGLANLRAFRARLEEEVKRARRYRTPLTCVMVDMDQLKPINDQLGHAAGDRSIAAVAELLRGELRETDFGARYGGDEFVVLLPHTTAEDGRIFAERACARLRETELEISGRRVALGASFGVACLSGDAGEDAADLLVRAADDALYEAKRGGRGRVAVAAELSPPARAG